VDRFQPGLLLCFVFHKVSFLTSGITLDTNLPRMQAAASCHH
jgi:hypothetical protein